MYMQEYLPFIKDGIPIEKFLEEKTLDPNSQLTNTQWLDSGHRVLYLIKPKLDNSLWKIGIAGKDSGKPSGRLRDYLYYYGTESEGGEHGVRIYYLAGTKYDDQVLGKDSIVFRKEKYIKDKFKERYTRPNRGEERFMLRTLGSLLRSIKDPSNVPDEQRVNVRRSTRIRERTDPEELNPTDTFEITGHVHDEADRNKPTKYEIRWSRPDPTTGDYLTHQTEHRLIELVGMQFRGDPRREAKLNEVRQKLRDYKDDKTDLAVFFPA